MTYGEVGAAISLLAERFPKCFAVFEQRRLPLKIGIHKDILTRLDGALTPSELIAALRAYVSNGTYRRRLLEGAERIDLDGNPSGVVTATQEVDARSKIAAANGRAAAARKQKAVQQPAQPAQPKRDGLSELRAAAQRRKAEVTG
jgi:ProP effector